VYIYRRGEGAKRRVMHVAEYDRLGHLTGKAILTCEIEKNVNLHID
jgi:hypothetical protein